MDSSLSSVPPVCPSARPLIMGTVTPREAARGARTSETLSPTPPVECLSTRGPGRSDRSYTSPEPIMARVRSPVSRGSIPRRNTAMARAAIW